MTVAAPAYSGSESVVGIVREGTWGTTPVTGTDPAKTIDGIVFIPIKEEGIELGIDAQPQTDDMSGDRELTRVIENGAKSSGPLRLNTGPDSIGYLLTMIFGSPTTTQIVAPGTGETPTPGVFQHVWYPGKNTRDKWPAFFSIESIYAALTSKLVQGAICTKLNLDMGNNAAVVANPDFGIVKDIIWLGTNTGGKGSATLDDSGQTRPAIMTASPVLVDESPWHWKHMKASSFEVDDTDEEMATSLSVDFEFPGAEGKFTGGSGMNLGTFSVDNFQVSGNVNILFQSEAYYEKFRAGIYFKLETGFKGDLITSTAEPATSYYNELDFAFYKCKATAPTVPNKVGALEYAIPWTGVKDPTEGKSCQITLQNSVADYKYPGEV